VDQILAESAGKFPATEVYFLTDLQRATWMPALVKESPDEDLPAATGGKGDGKPKTGGANTLQKIQQKALTVFIDVGKDGADNLAVTDLKVDAPFVTTGREVRIAATVRNYGSKARHQVRAELLVSRARKTDKEAGFNPNPNPAGRQVFDIERSEAQHLEFYYRFKDEGEYAVQVRLEADDLTLDDTRSTIVTVKKAIRVLLVNGKGSADSFDGASKYLAAVLNPFGKREIPAFIPRVETTVVTDSGFGDLTERDLEPYDCVFLCDVKRPGDTEIRRLKYLLRRGGGVVFCLGPEMAGSLDTYNRLLYEDGHGILPAKLLSVQEPPKDYTFGFELGGIANFQEPPLRAFDNQNGKFNLRLARFERYVRVKIPSHLPVRPILTWVTRPLNRENKKTKPKVNDDPAILMWQPLLPADKDRAAPKPAGRDSRATNRDPRSAARYRGRVGLITTTVNRDWTLWPANKSFLAMMQEILRLAIAGRVREQSALVGEPLEQFLPDVGEKKAVIRTPDRRTEKSQTQLTPDASLFQWADTDISGIYSVTIGNEAREHLFAVNVPATTAGQQGSESDFSRPRCDEALLKATLPGWRAQVRADPAKVDRSQGAAAASAAGDGQPLKAKIGPVIARWLLLVVLLLLFTEVILAWYFGHHTAVSGTAGAPPAAGRTLPILVGSVASVIFLVMAAVLVHAAWTGDFLGFLPSGAHQALQEQMGIPPAAEGESNLWDLEFKPYLRGPEEDPWLAGVIAVIAVALVVLVYLHEGRTARSGYKMLLAGLRLFMILVTLAVLLPQLQLRFERRGWPDLVILIDTSGSMGEPDDYQNEKVRKAAGELSDQLKSHLLAQLPKKIEQLQARLQKTKNAIDAKEAELTGRGGEDTLQKELKALQEKRDDIEGKIAFCVNQKARLAKGTWRPSRLQLVQALITLQSPDWVQKLVDQRRMKVYAYTLDRSGRARPLGEVTGQSDPGPHRELLDKIQELRAEARVSPLGTAVRKVLDDFSTSSLGAVVMFTDGITVESKDSDSWSDDKGKGRKNDLPQVAKYAAAKGVPLFLVGMGDAHGLRDIRLVRMDAPESVLVNDTIVFSVTARGYKDLTVPLKLYEKTQDGTLVELGPPHMVKIEADGREVDIKVRHLVKEAGEKKFVVRLELPKSPDPKKQPRGDYLQLERKVIVQKAQKIKVLYIEGTPRYEFRYIKTLLEREAPEEQGKKTVEIKVVLLDADDDYAKEDKYALVDLPPRHELFEYNVILFGDVNPDDPKIKGRLKDLADFVRERGGGFLMIAGQEYSPVAYKDTALEAILPVEPKGPAGKEDDDLEEGYRPTLTYEGQHHPIFSFSTDDTENMAIWNKLSKIYWWSEGYQSKPGALDLAVHPDRPSLKPRRPGDTSGNKHPLVVQQFVGRGRTLFFGFDESWRWRFREDELRFNQFWIQTVRFLAQSRPDRIVLRLNKQTPYTRGENIRITVRFPSNQPAPDKKTDVRVAVRRTPPAQGGAVSRPERAETLKLVRREEGVPTYEALVSRTQVGKYHFELQTPEPKEGPRPSAECEVIPPEGELERLSMNEADMRAAAVESGGEFFTLAEADQVIDKIPDAGRVSMDSSRPPSLLWNHLLMCLLVLGLLGSEWLLRKRKHLL
jgi:hypothetical protein